MAASTPARIIGCSALARDPNRIPAIIERLRAAWEKTPDMRLGQLIGTWGDPYYVEDDALVTKIELLLGGKA